MTLLPIIDRELRAESRSAFTYWLRFFGAVALLAVGVLFFLHGGLANMAGGTLFQLLHVTLFVAIWVVASLMTADSISRERREGTLGLLFLTPLRPIEVVLAKGLAHGLRAAGVCLATLPVLVVPFLMGGVGWRQALAAVLIDFSALCWALAAGILASSFCRTMTRALVMAVFWEGVAFLMWASVQTMGLLAAIPNTGRRPPLRLEEIPEVAHFAILRPHEAVTVLGGRGLPNAVSSWLIHLAVIAVASLVVCMLVAQCAAFNVRRATRDNGPSASMLKVEKQFCTPLVAIGFFRRWMRRVLDRNPIGWLERRTWQARLVTWSWLAVMMSVLSWVVAQGFFQRSSLDESMSFLGWLLVANIALTAAGSLRRERESGVIELLLVSPLTVQEIIGGRLRGIAGQFLPAVLMLLGVWLWMLHAFANTRLTGGDGLEKGLAWIGFFTITFTTLPVAGLYFSLRCRMFIVALFWTAGLGLALPWFVSNVSWVLLSDMEEKLPVYWRAGFGVVTTGVALALCRWPLAVSRGLSLLLAVFLALVALVSFQGAAWRGGFAFLPVVMTCSVLQIGIAILLGALLRRRLERREFALPQ